MFKNDIEYAVFNSTKNVSYAIFWMHMPNFLWICVPWYRVYKVSTAGQIYILFTEWYVIISGKN